MAQALRRRHRKLPERFRQFFWEYPFGRLSWKEDADLVTARLLAYGDWAALRWLRQRLGDGNLRGWLEDRRGAGLSPQQLSFWQLILKIPQRRIKAWLAEPGRAVWDQRRKA